MACPDAEGAHCPAEDACGEDLEFEISFFEAILAQVPDSVDVLMALSNNYTRQGHFDKGLATDQRLCQLRDHDPIIHYNLACSYSLLGRLGESLDALQHAVGLGYSDLAFMQEDPDLESIRRDPRYAAFLESLHRQQPTS